MSVFVLKIIALTSMLIDHVGAVFFTDLIVLRVIGRIAFPIFVYLIAEGFRHTRSPWRFLARLGAFAIISEIPFDLAFNDGINFFADTNIFYTLFLGGLAIVAYETLKNKMVIVSFVPTLVCMALAVLLSADYGAYGVFFVFCMYIIKNFRWRLASMVLLCIWQHQGMIFWGINRSFAYIPTMHLLMIPATLIPVALIAFYNGKRGRGLKWFFYIAYPLHLLVFGLIAA
ncbi:MAG: conjugal transfer protein TraX [Defluviitaleaceae bacterium]|nr:conjugal transfer protein TraX [Defluviitaleaceae bacterium]